MRPLSFIPLVLALLAAGPAGAQPPVAVAEPLARAQAAYQQAYSTGRPEHFRAALALFDTVARRAPSLYEAHYLGGLCAFALDDAPGCALRLGRAWATDSLGATADLSFYLGESCMRLARYDSAAQCFGRYLAHPNHAPQLLDHARQQHRKAEWARVAVRNPVAFLPVNLGPRINGPGEDYNAWTTADDSTLYFNSHREGCTGGPNPRVFHGYGSDFYVATHAVNELEEWTPARNVGPPLNTFAHEKEFWMSPDGRRVFYGLHPLFFAADGSQDCEIYSSTLHDPATRTWTTPRPVGGGASSRHCDSWPSLSRDGKTLYFVSDRPGGLGGYDIWLCEWNGQAWGPARNAGPTLNTPGNEFDVFIHPDGQTLYFCSDYHPGFGGQDIFVSRWANGRWGLPENLGWPLNSPGDDMDFFVNAAGTVAYINSDRMGGYGQADLYSFPLDARIRPRGVATVKGTARNPAGQPVPARVVIIDLATRDTVDRARADSLTGEFLVTLPLGAEYAAYIEHTGFLFDSEHFSLTPTNTERQFRLQLNLRPIAPGTRVVLNNVFFDVDQDALKPNSQLELNKVAEFLRANPHVQVELQGHTDSDGTPAHNLDLSRRRARVVHDYLAAQGVPTAQLAHAGYGHTQPRVPNTSPANKALNRRTELLIRAVGQ